jgi:hypothetical protein
VSEYLTEIITYTIAAVVAFPALCAIALGAIFARIRNADLCPLSERELDKLPALVNATAALDAEMQPLGFRFDGYYLETSFRMAVAGWQHSTIPATYMALYVTGAQKSTVVDLVTVLDGDIGLTTCNARDGVLVPPAPGRFVQCFLKSTGRQRWEMHRAAVEYLCKTGGACRATSSPTFPESFVAGVRRQARHVWRSGRWLYMGPYWFFVRRARWANVTIEQQHQRGWIRLPAELL